MPKIKPTAAAAAAAYACAFPKTPSMRTGTELPPYSSLKEMPAGIRSRHGFQSRAIRTSAPFSKPYVMTRARVRGSQAHHRFVVVVQNREVPATEGIRSASLSRAQLPRVRHKIQRAPEYRRLAVTMTDLRPRDLQQIQNISRTVGAVFQNQESRDIFLISQ